MTGWPAVLWFWTKGLLALMALTLAFFLWAVEPHHVAAMVSCAVGAILLASAFHQYRNPTGLLLESRLVLSIPMRLRKPVAVTLLLLGVFIQRALGTYEFPYFVLTGWVLILGSWLVYLHRNEEAT